MIDIFHPGLLLIATAVALPLLSEKYRSFLLLLSPIIALCILWNLPDGNVLSLSFMQYQLSPLYIDKLSRLFTTIYLIMMFTGSLYCFKQARYKELSFAYLYSGSAICVVLAADLISLFVFWEIMALASTSIIWCSDTNDSRKAGMRYLLMHLLGGVILMIGIIAHVQETDSINFTAMQLNGIASYLILIGFLLNAAAPPFSAWLSDAYPESTFSGMIFLSAFTTKTAVYVLLRGFPGTEILIFIGLYMIFYGIIYALLENDMRRILAYSIVNQVGFMVCGIGIGTEMALNGAAAHAFTHIIYKALLLMAAGSVLFQTGKRKCTDLGGLFQSMPITAVCGIIGALAISAFPLTSGFVSKSMVTQSAVDNHLFLIWLLLQAASAGVFLHAGIKFPWFVFFQKDSGLRPKDPPLNMQMAMITFAILCIVLGVFPSLLYALLPFDVNYIPYTFSHVLSQTQLLLFSGLAFFVMLPWMKRTLTISLDMDWFYRIAAMKIIDFISYFIDRIALVLTSLTKEFLTITFHPRNLLILKLLNRDIGISIVWILCLLSVCLIISLF